MKSKIDHHLSNILKALKHKGNDVSIRRAEAQIRITYSMGGTVWVVGNGGSLAIAQHFAQDLLKTCKVRAQTLNDGSVITAYANDIAFSKCHEEPLSVLFKPGRDCLVIFSCSGSSRNVADLPYKFNPVIAIIGTDGGSLIKDSDICIHVNSHDYDVCETGFSIVADILIQNLKERKLER